MQPTEKILAHFPKGESRTSEKPSTAYSKEEMMDVSKLLTHYHQEAEMTAAFMSPTIHQSRLLIQEPHPHKMAVMTLTETTLPSCLGAALE